MYLVRPSFGLVIHPVYLIALLLLSPDRSIEPGHHWHWLKLLFINTVPSHTPHDCWFTATNAYRSPAEQFWTHQSCWYPKPPNCTTTCFYSKPPTYPCNYIPKLKGTISKPEPYDGSPKKLDLFLCDLYLNLKDAQSYYAADYMCKICFMLLWMKLKFSRQWAIWITSELENGVYHYSTDCSIQRPKQERSSTTELEQLEKGVSMATIFFW